MEFSLAQTMPVLVSQIIAMVLMMAVGYVLFKLEVIGEQGVGELSSIIMYVATPAVILQAFVTEFSVERLVNGAWCAALSAVIMLASAAVARAVLGPQNKLARFSVVFTNNGFIGLPLVQTVLGGEYAFYVSMILAVNTIFVWTYGALLISGDKREVSARKILTNPAVVSLAVGVLIFCLSVDLPEPVDSALSGLGNINAGGAMLVLGAYLAKADFASLVRDKVVYIASLLRLIVMPLVIVALLWLSPIDLSLKLVLMICFATPSGGLVAMISQKYGEDYAYAVGLVAMSTLLSLVTLPAMMWVALSVL